jgi:hypothetical protein
MEDKKAAKKIIKRYKKHPNWYTQEEVLYAKMIKKKIKQNEKSIRKCESCQCDAGSGTDDGVCRQGKQS